MTRKEIVRSALRFENPGIVPYSFGFTVEAHEKMASYFGDESFEEKLGNYVAMCDMSSPFQDLGNFRVRDEFGVVWNRTVDKSIGIVEGTVIASPNDLKEYKFPDPLKPERYRRLGEFIGENRDRFVVAAIGFSLFERAWTLRGMVNLLVDMLERPKFVEELLDRILDYNLRVVDESLKYNIDAFYFGDDWGAQRGLIMGPVMWRRFIKPRLKTMYRHVRDAGKFVCIHSCGDVDELFPELIEIGLNLFNPFQPEVMDIYEVKRLYGDRLAFYGGLSIQRTLPFGTPEDVRSECRKLMREMGKNGGYILAPSHAIPGDVPVENILAMVDTAWRDISETIGRS
ncbi:MAG: uroporphyrinogen decarboxylase family protein [bacterium]